MARRRAIRVICADKSEIIVHEPTVENFGTYLRAMPALREIQRGFKAAVEETNMAAAPVRDELLEPIYPLFAIMCSITVDQFKALPLFDGLAVLNALSEFLPKADAVPIQVEYLD